MNRDAVVLCVGGEGTAARALERAGFAVERAESAAAARTALADRAVDCVVSAAALPDADGVDFLGSLGEPGPPAVLAPADGSEALAARALRAGASDYVPRSDASALAERVGTLAEQSVGAGAPSAGDASAILDALDDVFCVVDRDGTILRWNDALQAATGRGGLAGTAAADLFAPDDRERVRAMIDDGFDGERTVAGVELQTESGGRAYELHTRRVADGDAVTGLCLVGRDVTDRRAVEADLRATETALSRLYRISTDLALDFEARRDAMLSIGSDRLDLPYGFLTRIEDGVQYVEAATGDHDLLQPGESCPLSDAYCQRTIASDGLVALQDAPAEGWAGESAYEVFGLDTYVGGKVVVDGDLYGTLCFASTEPRDRPFSDVERRFVELLARWLSYELERRRHVAELEEKTEALEAFASVVSHDLRSPLTVVQGHLDMLAEEVDSDRVETAAAAADRIEAIVDDVLTLARTEDVDAVEPVALADAARDAWEHTDAAGAALDVQTDATVEADRGLLLQVLENLFRNAVEHGADDPSELTVRVGTLPEGAGFYVADTGRGLPEGDRSRLFEHGHSGGDGTGLGLSIVADVAEAHGWDVSVTESGAGGARFEVTGVDAT